MSDDMGTDKHGRRRRAIRRLTQRTIPLPTSASLPPPAASATSDDAAPSVTNAENLPLGASVANSLSELRLPIEGANAEAEHATGQDDPTGEDRPEPAADSSEARSRRDTREDPGTPILPPLAAEELPEEEPTNPKLPFIESGDAESRDRQASLPPPIGSDRPKNAVRPLETPPPQAAGDAAKVPLIPATDNAGANEGVAAASASDADVDDRESADTIELEVATSQFPRPLDSSDLTTAETSAAVGGKDGEAEPRSLAAELPPPRLDSDLPTRPRIELSREMAFAAGRVTSLEVPPIREDAPPKRGSKMPPSGEPRVISSLTGRRSSIPASSDEDEEASRPAVVVTRSKIISDRPPKPSDRPSRANERQRSDGRADAATKAESFDRASKIEAADRPAKIEFTDRPAKIETTDRPAKIEAADRPAKIEITDRPAKIESMDRSAKTEAADRSAKIELAQRLSEDRPSDLLERAARQEAERPPTASMRPSRRPGSPDGEEFETLDIEDGLMEGPALPLSRDSFSGPGADVVSSKAPPPPPQQKRGAAAPPAPAQLAPAPPPKAPPPPPRAASVPLTAATAATAVVPALAAVPNPAAPTAAGGAAVGASANAQPAVANAAAAAKKSGQKQPRRRQWWETLFSDEYLRTVVRPTAAQIARQVDFMHASLGVAKGSSVLDVGCGLGLHALEFARRGCLVVALDLALPMITRAAEDAQQEGLRINFLHKDIRDIGFEGTFDAVVCVGTTFGFFDDEQNREVLGRLANALKPGGRLLLEVVNRDHVLLSQPNLQWFEGDGCVVMEESDFNYYSSRLTVKRTMMREDGRQTESEYSIRLYALHELGQMMQQVGFRVKEVSGQQATRGVFFGAQSNRIILLAERKTQSPSRANGNGHSDVPPPGDS